MPESERVMEPAPAPLPGSADRLPGGTAGRVGLEGPGPAVVHPDRTAVATERPRSADRNAGADHPPAGAQESAPRNAEEARAAIERTRARLSRTLDHLEDRLIRTKHELRHKADVLGRLRDQVRGRELPALAAAFGVGLLIAVVLGGGRGGDEEVGLSPDEMDALRTWKKDRKHILEGLDRIASALEERED